MMGRAVLVLCLLTGAALACPADYEAEFAGRSDPSAFAFDPDVKEMPDGYENMQGLAVAFALMGLCGFAFAITRGNAVRRTFATSHHMASADLDALKAVARVQRRRVAAFAAVCTLALAALSALDVPVELRSLLSVTPSLLLAVAIVGLTRVQLLMGLEHEPTLRVLSHGHHLFVARGRRLVGWVAAPPTLLARASRLPVATLRH